MKKRILSSLFAVILAISLLSTYALADYGVIRDVFGAPGQDALVVNDDVTVDFRRDLDNQPASLYGLTYDENWFFEDSYEYNEQLAIMSLGLVLSGYDNKNYDTVNKTGDKYVKELFEKLEFPTDTYFSTGYNQPDDENIALAMSSKQISKDGEEYTLLAVDMRSGGYGGGGWKSNFNIGAGLEDTDKEDNVRYHTGFYNGATFALEQIQTYMTENDIDPENTKFWIVGYSRGAAVANLTSILLGDSMDGNRQNIFTYAGATPTYEVNIVPDSSYDNIHNLINTGDIVTMVPLKDWGFGIRGTCHELPALTDENRMDFERQFSELSGTEYYGLSDYTAVGEGITDFLAQYFDTREEYAVQLQPLINTLFEPEIDGKFATLVFIENLLTGDGNIPENADILMEIMSLAYGIIVPNNEETPTAAQTKFGQITERTAIVPNSAGIDTAAVFEIVGKITDARQYWLDNGDNAKAGLIENIINITFELYLTISSDGETDEGLLMQQMANSVLEAAQNGIASPMLFQHWTELYICRMRAETIDEPYVFSCFSEKLFVAVGYEISTDADFGNILESGDDIQPGTVYYVRSTESGGFTDSFTAPERPSTPDSVTMTKETAENSKDGTLSGVTDEMEYRIGNDGAWVSGNGEDITGFSDEVVYVRFKATETTFSGDVSAFYFAIPPVYDEPVYTWDGTSCTAQRICLSDETLSETEVVTASTEVTREKSCTLDELSTYTAVFENTAFTTQVKENVITAEKIGHSLIHIDEVPATSETDGVKAHYKCENCGALFADENAQEPLTAQDVIIPRISDEDNPGKTDPDFPKTGVDNYMSVLLICMFTSGAVLAGTIACRRKKRAE